MRPILAALALLLGGALPALAQPGVLEHYTETYDGVARSWVQYESTLPAPPEGRPVILLLHGGGLPPGGGEAFLAMTSLQRVAQDNSWLIIAPDSTCNANGSFCSWHHSDPEYLPDRHDGLPDVDDVRFLEALLGWAVRTYDVDPNLIVPAGVSAGGFMSYRLACQTDGLVAGIFPTASSLATADCPGMVGVALHHAHGGEDHEIEYEGGTYPPVEDGVRAWRQANGCPRRGQTTTLTNGTVESIWAPCATAPEVRLYLEPDAGHTWSFNLNPGGTNRSLVDFVNRL